MYIQLMRKNMVRNSATINENTTNSTGPKGQIQITYIDNH